MRERAATLPGRRASLGRRLARGLVVAGALLSLTTHADAPGDAPPPASFRVRLFGVAHVEGRFERISARLVGEEDGRDRIDAVIDLSSLHMDSPRQLAWARSDEFFDAARYPEIRFESEPLRLSELAVGDHIDGQLDLRGERHPVALWISSIDCAEPTPAPCSASAHTAVSRARFGMTSQRAFLSDRVDLAFELRIERPAR
jgi:polyisoprenoid-binding protein YceI